jgi:hypothetical protein
MKIVITEAILIASVITISTLLAEHLDERIKTKAALMGGFFNLVGDADEISKQLLDDIEVFSQFRALFE